MTHLGKAESDGQAYYFLKIFCLVFVFSKIFCNAMYIFGSAIKLYPSNIITKVIMGRIGIKKRKFNKILIFLFKVYLLFSGYNYTQA